MFDYTKKNHTRELTIFTFLSLTSGDWKSSKSLFFFPLTFWGKKRADLDRVKRYKGDSSHDVSTINLLYSHHTYDSPLLFIHIPLCYLYTLIRYQENFHTKSLTITPGLKFTSAIGLVYWTFEHVPDWSWYCLSFLFLFSFHTRLLLVLGTFKKLWYWPGPCIGAQDWFLAGMRQVYAWYDMTSLKLEQGRYYLWSLVPISHCY